MGESLWAAVAAASLGRGSGHKLSRSGHCVGTPAKGALGTWGLGRERGQQNGNQPGGKRGTPHPMGR